MCYIYIVVRKCCAARIGPQHILEFDACWRKCAKANIHSSDLCDIDSRDIIHPFIPYLPREGLRVVEYCPICQRLLGKTFDKLSIKVHKANLIMQMLKDRQQQTGAVQDFIAETKARIAELTEYDESSHALMVREQAWKNMTWWDTKRYVFRAAAGEYRSRDVAPQRRFPSAGQLDEEYYVSVMAMPNQTLHHPEGLSVEGEGVLQLAVLQELNLLDPLTGLPAGMSPRPPAWFHLEEDRELPEWLTALSQRLLALNHAEASGKETTEHE